MSGESRSPDFPGTLAMVGSGEYLPPMADVDRDLLSRVPEEPRVVCLPTGAGKEGAERVDYWSHLGVEHFTSLGVQAEAVQVTDRDSAMDEALAARIAAANFVYLSGGHPDYLYRTLAGTKAFDAITGVLQAGGVVAGCSAGAMIWGGNILGFRPPPWPWIRGFDYLPRTIIVPHYDEAPAWMVWPFRLSRLWHRNFIGIPGDTALVSAGGKLDVRGTGPVTVWNGLRRTHFGTGEHVTY